MDMTYAPYVPALTGQDARAFRQCARVFQHAQAYRLTVPWGLDRIDAVLDLLERDLFAPLAATPLPTQSLRGRHPVFEIGRDSQSRHNESWRSIPGLRCCLK